MNNTYNITMTRGDTFAFDCGMSSDIASSVDSVFLTVKSKPANMSYIFQKTFDDGIRKKDDKTFRFRIAPEDTESLTPGKYYYDIQLNIGDDVYTPLSGILKILQDVTF